MPICQTLREMSMVEGEITQRRGLSLHPSLSDELNILPRSMLFFLIQKDD
jgi:hypothetical protein